MKHSINSFLASGLVSCALAIGFAATPSSAFAQNVKADIPFAFQVGSTVLPAGTYIFTQQNQDIMLLRGPGSHSSALAMVLPETGNKAPKVGRITFNKYGDRYFLHAVSSSASSTAWQCTTTKQEKALIRELKNQHPTEVAVNVMPNLH